MSTQLEFESRLNPGYQRPVFTLIKSGWAGLVQRLNHWHSRAKTRRRLAQLPAYLHRDLGLRPDQVARELNRPFWR